MQHYRLDTTPQTPVSHNPELTKKVLVKEGFSCVRHLSHIALRPGDTAFAHEHADAFEVFYCVRGRVVFAVSGHAVTITDGSCLVIEPGEVHSIEAVHEETELVYMLAAG